MARYEQLSDRLTQLLELSWSPVAIKFLRHGEQPAGPLRRKVNMSFCEAVTKAAVGGHTMLVTPENLDCPNARLAFGYLNPLTDADEMAELIDIHVGVFAPDEESVHNLVLARPAIPPGEITGVVAGPLGPATFDPDCVVFTVNPAQANNIFRGLAFAAGTGIFNLSQGVNALTCAYGAVRAGYQHQINMVTSCIGGRTLASLEDTKVQVFIPGDKLASLLAGIEATTEQVLAPEV